MLGHLTEIGVVDPPRPPAPTSSSPSPLGHDPPHRLLADPPTDPARAAAGLFGGIGWDGGPCSATGRSTCGCTSRTYAAPSAGPAAWTSRPPRAHGRLPGREPRLRGRQAGRRPRRHDRGARDRGPARRAASPSATTAAAGASGARRCPTVGSPPTASRSCCSPEAGATPNPGRSARRRRGPRRGDPRERWRPPRERSASVTLDLADLPDQTGRTTLVTGVHRRRARLPRRARAGPARRPRRARRAAPPPAGRTEQAIRAEVPGAELDQLVVDVSDLTSVRRAAAEAARLGPIHCWSTTPG